MDSSLDEITNEIVSPLLRRVESGGAGFVIVLYPGSTPEDLMARIGDKFHEFGIETASLALEDIAPNPVSGLAERQADGFNGVFSIHVTLESLRIGNEKAAQCINALNLHRDGFRDRGLCAVFWMPSLESSTFFERAANFMDYRARIVELPPEYNPDPEDSDTASINNLPFAALGNDFKGREGEMESLGKALHEGDTAAVTQPIGIQGLGGIGKTRLVVEYAWRHLEDHSHVLFVRADSDSSLRANLARLTHHDLLNIAQAEEQGEEERCQAVIHWLKSNAGWLLILDNADTEEAVKAVNDLLPRIADEGATIITSRYRRWGKSMSRLDLGVFNREEAVQFLLDHTKGFRPESPDDEKDAQRLADLFDRLPLAMEQAAAYVRVHGISLGSYLDTWERAKLEWHDPRMTDYPRSVAGAFEMSTANLEELPAHILGICAWLAPDPIPVSLLLNTSLWKSESNSDLEKEIRAAIEKLFTLSLLERSDGDTFAMHRVIQEAERNRVRAPQRKERVMEAVALLNDAVPWGTDDVRTWPVVEPLRPHADMLLSFAIEQQLETAEASALMSKMGSYYKAKALFKEAEPLMRRAPAIDETSFGSEHPDVASDIGNLAQLLQHTNQMTEAEPLMRCALAIDEACFGAEHPDVARDLGTLAQLLQHTNQMTEAEPLMRRALAISEKSLGEEHPQVAISLNNLASLLQDTGRAQEALPLLERAVDICEQSLVPDHPWTLAMKKNLVQMKQVKAMCRVKCRQVHAVEP
jgi:tetratricopeptide (TPR) repeat protein